MGDMGGTTRKDNPANWMNLSIPGGSNDNVVKDVPSRDISRKRVIDEAAENYNNNNMIPFALPVSSSRIPNLERRISHNGVNFFPTSSAVMHADHSARDKPRADDLVAVRGIHNPKGLSGLERGMLYNSSAVMHADHSARDKPRADDLVAVRGIHNPKGLSGLERGMLYNSSGNDSEASNSYHDKDNALEATQSGQRLNKNNNNGKAPMSLSRFLQSDEENCSVPVALCLSSHDGGESSKVCERPTVTVAVPGLRSSQEVPSEANMSRRMQRARITEILKSLQELLPHFEGVGRESILDSTIDYVKCLQLQFKTLSQSRLGGEASHDPFVYLEGYGHYLFHDEMLSAPLEEIIGQLVEVNLPLLNQLLENKGLVVMPMGLAGGLLQLPGRGSSAPSI